MQLFRSVLRGTAVALGMVSLSHLALGLEADQIFGAQLSLIVVADPVLSSQNRFFGVSYALYAAILWLAASDLSRYAPALRAALWITVAAGLARLVAWRQFGAPSPPILILLALEIILPPILLIWTKRVEQGARTG